MKKFLLFPVPGVLEVEKGWITFDVWLCVMTGTNTSTTGSGCQTLSPSESGGRSGRSPQR